MDNTLGDINYLQELLAHVSIIKNKVKYKAIIPDSFSVTYMATKKESFIGKKSGYAEQLLRIEKGIKESEKIRANCKDYLKIFRNEKGRVLQIESYVRGRLDCLFQAYYDADLYYLFPFSSDGGFYPTYAYVTRYEGDKVVEEYMVEGNQIVYECYLNETKACVNYYFINYVKDGKYPIIEKRKGIFRFAPLRYENIEIDTWLEYQASTRQKKPQ